ncbi:MAG: flavin reductase [Alphaproteobacteria bacterium]|nr:flavin reductase [Alphaproteobacteria bacterium]
MDLKALFKISHGVYITGAKDENGRLIGSCIDAVMVAEVSPAQILVSMGKGSYTAQNVIKSKKMTLSVLATDAADSLIQNFGMQSSRDADKWANVPYDLVSDLPVLKDAVATMDLRIAQVQETATHFVFLCDVIAVSAGTMKDPLIYQDYQNRKRKEEKMSETKKWVCSVCGYVYDGEIPFEELPEDWVCPICGEGKSVFVQE